MRSSNNAKLTVRAADFTPEERVDVGPLISQLLAKWWWIAASVVLIAGGFAVSAFTAKRVYRATVVLVPARIERVDSPNSLANSVPGLLLGIGAGNDSEMQEALAVLRSREFTEQFIQEHGLTPKLFADLWDSSTGTWKVPRTGQPTLSKAYRYFDHSIRSTDQDKKTGLINLQIDWTDRTDAAAWANDLVRELNEKMRARAVADSDASMRFLEQELQTTSTVEVRDAISRLMEAQLKRSMVAKVTPDYSFRVVDKATVPDSDDPVWPRKRIMVAEGAGLGLFVGVLGVLLYDTVARRKTLQGRGTDEG